MIGRRNLLFIIALVFWISGSVPGAAKGISLKGRVVERTLSNGIQVLLLKRSQSPTLSFAIRFRVGAADENLGMTGTAHLLEHMLFKGTKTLGTRNWNEEERILSRIDTVRRAMENEKNKEKGKDPEFLRYLEKTLQDLQAEHKKWVVKDEIGLLYSQNGAVGFNAMTSVDTTTYVVNLPANRLELWARIESDRILNPVLREFYSERDVVMEERHRSIDSQPERKLVEHFLAVAFLAHPYGRPVIGWASDIAQLERNATERFFRRHYSPANMVLTVAGDQEPQETLEIIQKYFARIPRQILPPPLATVEPEQAGERRLQVWADAKPQLVIGFHKPNPPHPDDTVCEIIEGLLSSGRTSRLYRKLVEETRTAAEVSAYNGFPGQRFPNLFVFFGVPRHPHTAEELEKAILEEIQRLGSEAIPEKELQKVKNQIQTDFLRKLDSNSQLAYWLSYGQSLLGNWRTFIERREACEQVTSDDVRRVAQKVFSERNRTVAILINPAKGTKEKE
jgi:predicted Zn-dependent peptidase